MIKNFEVQKYVSDQQNWTVFTEHYLNAITDYILLNNLTQVDNILLLYDKGREMLHHQFFFDYRRAPETVGP